MKTLVCSVVVLTTGLASAAAFAQNAPLRGIGLLASDAGESPRAGAHLQELVAFPEDDGGGAVGSRALRGSDGGMRARSSGAIEGGSNRAVLDAPGGPAAETPKRPTYRWQSLVPGAIK